MMKEEWKSILAVGAAVLLVCVGLAGCDATMALCQRYRAHTRAFQEQFQATKGDK
jgi:predicted small secreted protein